MTPGPPQITDECIRSTTPLADAERPWLQAPRSFDALAGRLAGQVPPDRRSVACGPTEGPERQETRRVPLEREIALDKL